ncbi:MAG: DNA polymerase III subunit delta' [Bacillota bacterium]
MHSFNDIIGHHQAVTTLQNALQAGRVAHAYLFHGPEGAGKSSLARVFAMAYFCREKTADACGECADCRKFLQGNYPDYREITGSGGAIKIDQVREIQREAQYTSYEGIGKVFLLTQADNLTPEAANCLLKVLEEPPPGTVFLLTADNPYRLLPTILSRCQQIPLRRVSVDEIAGELVSRWGKSPGDARVAALLSDGLPGKAIVEALEQAGLGLRREVLSLLKGIKRGEVTELFSLAEEMEKSREQTRLILDLLTLWYRDQLVWLTTRLPEMIINIDLLEEIKAGERLGPERLMTAIDELSRARGLLAGNANFRLVLEVLLLKLAKCA